MKIPMSEGIGDKIIVKSKSTSTSYTIPVGSSQNIDIDITESGYTPIGIVGLSFSGGRPDVTGFYIRTETEGRLIAKNDSDSAVTVTGASTFVLYKKK